MVEENPVAGVHTVPFPVVPCHPVGVDLRTRIGAPWVERCFFILRRSLPAEHLAAGCLVEPDSRIAPAGGLEQTGGPEPGDVPGILRCIKADPDVALGREVIDLIGPDFVHDIGDLLRV